MSPRIVPGIGLLRWIAALVPSDLKATWLAEWEGELSWSAWQGPTAGWRMRKMRLMWAAFMDAIWIRSQRSRESRVGSIWVDGWRSVWRRPGFTGTVVTTLALGLGGVTAAFTVLDAALFRAMPYAGVERLVETARALPGGYLDPQVDRETYEVWRRQGEVFEALEARRSRSVVIRGGLEVRTILAAWFTSGVFELLGIAPVRGRTFGASDADGVVVVSETFLRQESLLLDEAVGSDIIIDGIAHEVIGVMPESFRYPELGTMVFLPILDVEPPVVPVGRLRAGLDVEGAAAAIGAIAARLEVERPREGGWDLHPMPVAERGVHPQAKRVLVMLLGGTLGVLLIACVNVANLLLVNGVARTRELSIRGALGATRGRIAGQLLVESLMLAMLGAAAGVLFASAAVRLFLAIAPLSLTQFAGGPVRLDARVLTASALLGLATSLVFGVGPALAASRSRANLAAAERASTGGRRMQQVRAGLAIVELALAMTLLVTAGLLLRSLAAILARDPGYDADEVLVMDLWLPPSRYPEVAAQQSFYEELLERVRALPGVEQVTLAGSVPPVSGFQVGPELQAEGMAPLEQQPMILPSTSVDTSFFATLGIPIVQGRAFNAADVAGAPPVAIVDTDLARALWPRASPLGQRFRTSETSTTWLTVVGVAADVEMLGVAEFRVDDCRSNACDYEVYQPIGQNRRAGQHGVAIRTTGDPNLLAAPMRELVRALDDSVPLPAPESGIGRIRSTLQEQQFVLRVMLAFTLLAIMLAAIGVYSVLAHGVIQRTREIGVRMALGAATRDVLGGVLRNAGVYAACGVALGALGSIAMGRIVANLIVDVSARDPWAISAAGVLLALVAVAAAVGPARRALAVSPIDALRVD